MDRLGHQLLARAAFAGHEHMTVAVGNLADGGEELSDRRTLADDIAEIILGIDLLSQGLVLLHQFLVLEQLFDLDRHILKIERLEQIVIGSLAQGLQGGLE